MQFCYSLLCKVCGRRGAFQIGKDRLCSDHYQERAVTLKSKFTALPVAPDEVIALDFLPQPKRPAAPAGPTFEDVEDLISFAERPLLITWRDRDNKKRRLDQMTDDHVRKLYFFLQRHPKTVGHKLCIRIVGAELTKRRCGHYPPQFIEWCRDYQAQPENDRLEIRI